jgi:hypothetical protein
MARKGRPSQHAGLMLPRRVFSLRRVFSQESLAALELIDTLTDTLTDTLVKRFLFCSVKHGPPVKGMDWPPVSMPSALNV